jgi:hypothetical protein
MALALFDRVQETTTTTGTGSVTLGGAVPGFQSFAVVGNGNTCYYTIVDGSAWEVGVGTYSTSGPTLARTTILSNSNGNTTAITLAAGTKSVFLTYPASKSVNLNESGNVSPLGTVSSGVWQGTTVGVAYGGTGVTASSGANSVMLRDANQNVSINRLNQSNTNITAAAGTTALTAASSYSQTLVGTGNQTIRMPDATTLTTGVAFEFNNNATGTLTLTDYASATIGTVTSGGAVELVLLSNGTVGGTWDVHGYIPENVTWGTNALNLGSTVISGGTWQGGTIATGYGGTGLTSYTSGGAVYANSSTTLTSGTLPVTAGGTGATTASGAQSNLNVPSTTGSGASGTWGINITGSAGSLPNAVTFNSGGAGDASGTSFNGAAARTISYNTIGAPSTSGTNASGTWSINITGAAGSATNATNSTYLASQDIRTLSPSSTAAARLAFGFTSWANNNSSPWADYLAMRSYSDASGGNDNLLVLNKSTIAMRVYQQAWGSASAYSSYADVLMSNNYNSYTPTLTGTGATGTWNINITGSAGTAGSVDYNALTNKTGGTGTYTTSGDYRAPIFYDTNDTSYYVDPNATSSLRSVNYWGLQQWAGNDVYAIGTPGYGFRFNNNANTINAFIIDNSGNTTSYASSRAPIFYDSNDTGYYVDPNGSISASFAGQINSYRNDTQTVLQTFNTSAGSPGQFNIRHDYANVILENTRGVTYVYGSYLQTNSSARAPIFYDSDDTGYYIDPNSTSNTALRMRGGALFGPNVTWGQYLIVGGNGDWNTAYASVTTTDGNLHLDAKAGNAMYLNYYAGTAVNFGNGASGGIFAQVASDGSFRSPIFYDYSNTSYYVDPAGTTYLSTTNLQDGKWYTVNNQSGQSINIYVRPNGDNTYVWRHIYGGTGTGFGTGVGGYGIYNETLGGDYSILFNPAGFVTSPYSFRAPIFYDSNNTGYYLDPSATGVSLNSAGNLSCGNGGSNTGLFIYYGAGSGDYAVIGRCYQAGTNNQTIHVFSTAWQGGTLQSTAAGSINLDGANGTTIGAWNIVDMWIDKSGNSQSRTSSRAPIFYDSNDTGYYVDPNGTSYLNVVGSPGRFYTGYDSGQTNSFNCSNWFRSSGNTGWYNASYEGGIYMIDSTWVRVYNNKQFYSSNYIESGSSVRAPIFYDSNDTAFYGDFASSSRLNEINLVSKLTYTGSGGSGVQCIDTSTYDGYVSMRVIRNAGSGNLDGMYIGYANGNSGVTRIFGGGSTGGEMIKYATYTEEAGSFRAPIFYDSNNTGYYVDPASGSNLNGTLINNGGTAMTAGWNRNLLLSSTFPVIVFNSASSKYSGIGVDYSSPGAQFIFWINGTSSDISGTGTSAMTMNSGNFVTANGSFRAPIFYDSDDTTYYVNPASGTYLFGSIQNNGAHGNSWIQNRLLAANNGAATGEVQLRMWCSEPGITWDWAGFGYNVLNDGGSPSGFGRPNTGFGQAYMRMSPAGEWFFYNVTTGASRSTTMQLHSTGYVTAFQSSRAPIFYDSDDTQYYVNPNSITSLRTIGSWRSNSDSWDGEFSGKMQYHSNYWYIQSLSGWFFRNSGGANVMNCDSSGNVTFSGNVTAYSDARIKENVVTIDSALNKVLNLRGVYYNKIGTPERRVGVIAQEVETVLPEVVRLISDTNPSTGETQELLAVDYGNIAGLLIEAAKEQNQEVLDLRNRVAQLESLIHKLIGD